MEVIPMLRRQKGFRDVVALAFIGGTDIVAISLWDSKEHAEAYNSTDTPRCSKA
jgi:heme-degrading monooxygenase HmoA